MESTFDKWKTGGRPAEPAVLGPGFRDRRGRLLPAGRVRRPLEDVELSRGRQRQRRHVLPVSPATETDAAGAAGRVAVLISERARTGGAAW